MSGPCCVHGVSLDRFCRWCPGGIQHASRVVGTVTHLPDFKSEPFDRDLSDLEGGDNDERHVIDQLRAQLAEAQAAYEREARCHTKEVDLRLAAERRAAEAEAKLKTGEERARIKMVELMQLHLDEKRALRAEVERLRFELSPAGPSADEVNKRRELIKRWRAEVQAPLRVDNDRLRAALRKYGRHDGPCLAGFDGELGRRHPCSCGLDAALGKKENE